MIVCNIEVIDKISAFMLRLSFEINVGLIQAKIDYGDFCKG